MTARSRLTARTGLVALAVAVAVATAGTAPAHADPAVPAVPGLSALNSLALGDLPLDSELAEALRTLKSSGGEDLAISALEAILGAEGSPDLSTLGLLGSDSAPGTPSAPTTAPSTPSTSATPTPEAGETPDASETDAPETDAPETTDRPGAPTPSPASATPADDTLTTAATGLEAFEKLTGAKVLTPAFAPFCAATTEENPLGLAFAPAVGIPGPFPNVGGETPVDAFKKVLNGLGIPGLDDLLENDDVVKNTSVLTADQTAYALLPPTGHTNDKFQVAWFNTTTMQGNIADLTSLDKIDSPILQALGRGAPIRLARVGTGQGSILTAVFGTTTNNGRTCYFLPAIGVVETPAT